MVVNRITALVLPATTRFVVDDIIGKRDLEKLPLILAMVLGATAIQALSSLGMTHILSKGGQRAIAETRVRLQAHMQLLPISFYDGHKVGTLVSRIMSDVEGIRNLMGTGFVDFIGSLLTALLAFIALFYLSPEITAVSVLFTVAFVYSLFRSLKTLWPLYWRRVGALADIAGRLTESFGGMRIVKGFGAEVHETARFSRDIERALALFLRAITSESVMTLLSQITGGLLGIWVVYSGIHMVVRGQLSLGGYLTYNILLAYIIAPLTAAVNVGVHLTDAVVGIERVLDVMEEEQEHERAERSVNIERPNGRIVFDRVTFGYCEDTPVLHNVSFIAEPNQITALVGPSGSGKTTIANLICAFYSPQIGQITVDGFDLRTLRLSSYRTHLGVVLQDNFLFHGTIRENVAFARPDVTDEEIQVACRIAQVNEFVDEFPLKYETVVGERGVTLSGGQKQRISIARALLHNPRILILDEATSSLDSESEQIIQNTLRHLMRDRTTIMIAHRLSTIRRADQILVVEKGRILARGTHDELYAGETRYRQLYDGQYSPHTQVLDSPFTSAGES
jgi:ABC-type multidrug transport system fused ATPase/permease subunit